MAETEAALEDYGPEHKPVGGVLELPELPVPPDVRAAFQFVALTVQSHGPVVVPCVGGGAEVHEREMHPAHEGCYRLALLRLGGYFQDGR